MMGAHLCHVPGCRTATPPRLLMCPAHWRLVPDDIQREVYATVGKRGRLIDASWAAWWRAQTKATHAVMQAEGREPEKLARWFEREMRVADEMEKRT